jgi:hypothetical protein
LPLDDKQIVRCLVGCCVIILPDSKRNQAKNDKCGYTNLR